MKFKQILLLMVALMISILVLFIPGPYEIFKGSHSLGHPPFWMGYIAFAAPEYLIGFKLVLIHLIITISFFIIAVKLSK